MFSKVIPPQLTQLPLPTAKLDGLKSILAFLSKPLQTNVCFHPNIFILLKLSPLKVFRLDWCYTVLTVVYKTDFQ